MRGRVQLCGLGLDGPLGAGGVGTVELGDVGEHGRCFSEL